MWALLRFAFARILPKSQNASEHEIETGDYINDLGFDCCGLWKASLHHRLALIRTLAGVRM